MIFYVFDRWGKQIDTISDAVSAVHTDEINGEDSLSIEIVGDNLEKGQRIVWRDKFGAWHEHTVADLNTVHEEGRINTVAYCENSISELLTDPVIEKEPSGSAFVALTRALENTRWQAGTVSVQGNNKTSWYHISAYAAVTDIVEVWGGELTTTIEVSGATVTSRKVNILARRGGDYGQVFTYGRNLTKITRRVEADDVCTALYGYGKGLEKYDEQGNPTGGFSRKLTFGSINGGLDWVGDEQARLKWGLPDGKGGVKHTFGQVEFSDCEDEVELLDLTKEELKSRCVPRVSYEGTVEALGEGGYANGEDTQPGDTVYIRDKPLNERLNGRALKVERNLKDESQTVITLGNITRNFSDSQKGLQADLDWLKNQATGWDSAANLTDAFLNAVINNWNEVINADGGYVYWEQGEGITIYDKPRDQNPTKAIQLKGGAFRIANDKASNGDWNWRTFGTGDGFVADLLVAGKIVGGANEWNLETGDLQFKQGGIYDSAGKNYWNLDTGEFKLSANDVKIDGKALDKYIEDNDSFSGATATEVFNKLTNNGAVKGITMSNNRLYINADYINTGTFSVNNLFSANKTQGKVTIAGFTVAENEMQGDYVKIGHKAITIQSENQNLDIGDLTASYSGNATGSSNVDRWICLAVNNQALASGIAFTIKDNPDNKYSMVANYAKSKQSTENVTAGSWNFYKNIDMHGNRIHNAVVTSANTMAIGNSVGDEISFLAPTKINDDGTIAEYAEVKLEYTNGILTRMQKPEVADG